MRDLSIHRLIPLLTTATAFAAIGCGGRTSAGIGGDTSSREPGTPTATEPDWPSMGPAPADADIDEKLDAVVSRVCETRLECFYTEFDSVSECEEDYSGTLEESLALGQSLGGLTDECVHAILDYQLCAYDSNSCGYGSTNNCDQKSNDVIELCDYDYDYYDYYDYGDGGLPVEPGDDRIR